MVSGYFAYCNSTEKIISKMKNIIKIYFWGAVIYFCFYGILTLYDSGIKAAVWYGISYFNPVFIFKFVIFNLPRSSEHLWFLVALIYVYALHYFIDKLKIKESIYLWIGVVLLAIHLLLGVGLSSIGIVIPICVIRNFLLMGYPFYCIGMLIRKNEDLIHKKFTYKRAMILILIGVIETVISYFICGGNELYIGSVLVAVALLIISLKAKDIQINEKLIKLSQASTGIYLIHLVIGYSLERIVATDMPVVKNVFPFLVCIISTFVVLLSERIKETKKPNKV
jgi:surface polysaccharide O-acyltransferase-like enzyme